ncbi:hypothetical protein GH741_05330 [Aquibacillus halophilus]|uniref:Uncharacterized protein n=1 Tax=Aquibacillus halophilus TaxID=930132 RepID=A0A6A8DC37_9BACI|nr:hypothetical protein [Aquibacillus halophilus]MRH42096.1 hypothetical protein [Aquibacillus halophilus]
MKTLRSLTVESGVQLLEYTGHIFSGNFSKDDHSFYLKRVKHLDTQSTLSTKQIAQLRVYLTQKDELNESCTITVNDQIPLLLNKEEVHELLQELETISESI